MSAVLLLALVACGPKQAPPAPAEPAPVSLPEPGESNPDAPYVLVDPPTLSGRVVQFAARFGGGCAEHTFRLEPGPRTPDAPTVQPLALKHDDGGDRCRGIRFESHELSLEDLLQDCTESILVTGLGEDGAKVSYPLTLEPSVGCQ